MKRLLLTSLVLLCGSLASVPARAQRIILPTDAEYMGALLDSSIPITLYRTGRLQSAILKTDYARDGLVFRAGTSISFYEDGRLSQGTLKDDAVVDDFTFTGDIAFRPDGRVSRGVLRSGTTRANLVIPPNASIQLDGAGRVTGVDGNGRPRYPVLGRTVRGAVGVAWDTGTGRYRLATGEAVEPQLVAHMVTARDAMGSPTQVPVVVPAYSHFRLRAPDEPASPYDLWYTPSFQLNGNDFGRNAMLMVRDMRVVAIQIREARTIAGRQYNANDVIWLDDGGRIVTR